MKRFLLAFMVTLGLAPGTFVRSELSERDDSLPGWIEALEVGQLAAGPLVLEGGWELASANPYFGGFSSLVVGRGGEFLSANDMGRLIAFPRPDRERKPILLEPFLASTGLDEKLSDVESLAIDPSTGALWAALERSQEIIAVGPQRDQRRSVQPPEMEHWPVNSGPEAMVRLADGRFLVIAEHEPGGGQHEALLFPGDPVAGGRPMSFRFQTWEGFHPSDAALLPDGRVAVLLRKVSWALPPRFPVQIVIADPRDIGEGAVLTTTLLARIEAPLPSDNYEGLAVIDEGDGSWTVWMISDDNFASFQRTLLLKFRWDVEAEPCTAKGAQVDPTRL